MRSVEFEQLAPKKPYLNQQRHCDMRGIISKRESAGLVGDSRSLFLSKPTRYQAGASFWLHANIILPGQTLADISVVPLTLAWCH